MAGKPVFDAVKAYLTANFNSAPLLDLDAGENPPADGSAFLQLQFPVGKETFIGMASVGNRTFREDGAARFVLSSPRTGAFEQALAIIETLRDLFRATTINSAGTVVIFREATPPTTGVPSENYWVLSFAVTYYFDAFK